MKKIALAIVAALSVSNVLAELVIYEGFDYTVGSTVAGNGSWISLNPGTPPVIASGNLTTPGLEPPTGEEVSFDAGNIQEALMGFSSLTSGTVYYSFEFQLTTKPTGATYSFSLSNNNTFYAAAVWFQAAEEGFSIGLSNRSNTTPIYDTTVFSLNTTYFVVGAYTFNPETGDNVSSLWINPSPVTFGGLPPTPTLTATGGTDLDTISQFLLRGANGSPSGILDEVRIGTSYADVTPVPEPQVFALTMAGLLVAVVMLRRQRNAC